MGSPEEGKKSVEADFWFLDFFTYFRTQTCLDFEKINVFACNPKIWKKNWKSQKFQKSQIFWTTLGYL